LSPAGTAPTPTTTRRKRRDETAACTACRCVVRLWHLQRLIDAAPGLTTVHLESVSVYFDFGCSATTPTSTTTMTTNKTPTPMSRRKKSRSPETTPDRVESPAARATRRKKRASSSAARRPPHPCWHCAIQAPTTTRRLHRDRRAEATLLAQPRVLVAGKARREPSTSALSPTSSASS
jgi:hypothetical protein